jgi:hypothetical protein
MGKVPNSVLCKVSKITMPSAANISLILLAELLVVVVDLEPIAVGEE